MFFVIAITIFIVIIIIDSNNDQFSPLKRVPESNLMECYTLDR